MKRICIALCLACLATVAYGKKIADIPFARIGIIDLTLDLYLPEVSTGKVPLVVWIHGGGMRQGNKDKCPVRWVTDHGYAAASISYRLSNVAQFPAQIHDCKGAIRWLRANAATYGIDPDRIAVVGHSAGAALATLLGTSAGDAYTEGSVGGNLRASSSVSAVVCVSGTVDYELRLKTQPEIDKPDSGLARYFGGVPGQMMEQVRRASAVHYLTQDDPPVMIFHGGKETKSHFIQSARLHSLYKQKGLESTQIIVDGAAHNDIDKMFCEENRKRILAFFKRAFSSGKGKAALRPAAKPTEGPVSGSKRGRALAPLPVPDQFRDVDPARVRQYLPRLHAKRTFPFIKAADAPLGYAAPVRSPDMPFSFGFFQNDRATKDKSALPKLPHDSKAIWKKAGSGAYTLQRELTAGDIAPGRYHIYELGEIEVTPPLHHLVFGAKLADPFAARLAGIQARGQ